MDLQSPQEIEGIVSSWTAPHRADMAILANHERNGELLLNYIINKGLSVTHQTLTDAVMSLNAQLVWIPAVKPAVAPPPPWQGMTRKDIIALPKERLKELMRIEGFNSYVAGLETPAPITGNTRYGNIGDSGTIRSGKATVEELAEEGRVKAEKKAKRIADAEAAAVRNAAKKS